MNKSLIVGFFLAAYIWISAYRYYYFVYLYDDDPIPSTKPLLDCKQIDIVYTWVNGSEPIHMHSRMKRLNISYEEAVGDLNRFRDLDGLKYSLRSVFKYAPWVGNIFIVTDNQYPNWFNLEKTLTKNADYIGEGPEDQIKHNIKFIFHSEYFDNLTDLPTFNSNAIEINFRSLPDDVSDCFINMNDDVFFSAPVKPEDFFHPLKGNIIYEDSNTVSDYSKDNELFSNSLRHSNSVLNALWGRDDKRHLAEHGPILFHKRVFREMVKWIPEELKETSSHYIRRDNDLQVPFVYLHFTKNFFQSTVNHKSINKYAGLIDDYTKMKKLFRQISTESYKTICLNDGLSPFSPNPKVLNLYHKTLNEKFPNKGYWEL